MSEVTKHLVVRGVVQGVGYRYSMNDEARRLGVKGWVRNRRDGSVEAVVQGSAQAVEAIIAWAGRGPMSAVVEKVDVTDVAQPEVFQGFESRPTA
jgi:acylphosphatase